MAWHDFKGKKHAVVQYHRQTHNPHIYYNEVTPLKVYYDDIDDDVVNEAEKKFHVEGKIIIIMITLPPTPNYHYNQKRMITSLQSLSLVTLYRV